MAPTGQWAAHWPHLMQGLSPSLTSAAGAMRSTVNDLLRFVAAYCLFDAMNVVFVSAIRGAGDMRFILCTTLVMAPTPVVVAWWGMAYYDLGLMWCWVVITFWVCSLGLIYLSRFLHGRWRTMRVIEPELLAS